MYFTSNAEKPIVESKICRWLEAEQGSLCGCLVCGLTFLTRLFINPICSQKLLCWGFDDFPGVRRIMPRLLLLKGTMIVLMISSF